MTAPLSRLPPGILLLLLFLAGIASCGQVRPQPKVYLTEYGLGPDKWATAWLLTRRPGTNDTLRIVDPAAAADAGTLFDVPQAAIRRIESRAAFEVAVAALQLSDPVIDRLAQIVHHIEVDFWATQGPAEADTIEAAYRDLQRRHGRDQVTPECYLAFFDRVYALLRVTQPGASLAAARLGMSCDELVRAASSAAQLIPEVPVEDVLDAMAAGRRVVFVDVREADEFAEGHIPDALNIPLRGAGPHLAARFRGADYVVSYCVKDFRGFEMAKALAAAGVENSVIMRPYGIKGWAALGLPVTGSKALSQQDAARHLRLCLSSGSGCPARRDASAGVS